MRSLPFGVAVAGDHVGAGGARDGMPPRLGSSAVVEQDDRRTRWFSALGTVVTVAAVTGAVLGAVTYGVVRAAGLAEPSSGGASPRAAGADDIAARPAPQAAQDSSGRRSRTAASGDSSRKDQARRHELPAVRRDHRRAPRRPVRPRAEHQPGHRARHEPKQQARQRLTLSVDRQHVGRMGRVHLFGRYSGHAGTVLVVQRLEHGRWARFPVTVVVRDGRFRTWVASGRPGPNRFRVRDPGAHRPSTPVTVTVR